MASEETTQAVRALFAVIDAMREALIAAGPRGLKSGPFYATLMSTGMSYHMYQALIDKFVEAGCVKRGEQFSLIWIGPTEPTASWPEA